MTSLNAHPATDRVRAQNLQQRGTRLAPTRWPRPACLSLLCTTAGDTAAGHDSLADIRASGQKSHGRGHSGGLRSCYALRPLTTSCTLQHVRTLAS